MKIVAREQKREAGKLSERRPGHNVRLSLDECIPEIFIGASSVHAGIYLPAPTIYLRENSVAECF